MVIRWFIYGQYMVIGWLIYGYKIVNIWLIPSGVIQHGWKSHSLLKPEFRADFQLPRLITGGYITMLILRNALNILNQHQISSNIIMYPLVKNHIIMKNHHFLRANSLFLWLFSITVKLPESKYIVKACRI